MSPRARHAAALALLVGAAAGLGWLLHARRAQGARDISAAAAVAADWRSRANLALGLGWSADPRDLPVLIAALDDPRDPVRANALFALRRRTGMAWATRTAECRAWWTAHGVGGAQPPSALMAFEPRPVRDPDLVPDLSRISPAHVVLDAGAPAFTLRWTLDHRGDRPRAFHGAGRDVHWAYRWPAEGGGLLDGHSILPYAFVTVCVVGLEYGTAGEPRILGAESGSTLDRVRLAPRSCLDGTVSFPLPGAGEEDPGFLVMDAWMQVEPWFEEGMGLMPRAAAARPSHVAATARPRWHAETSRLAAVERARMPEQATEAGLYPTTLAVFHVRVVRKDGKLRDAGTEPARPIRAIARGPCLGRRPFVYLAGVGWVHIERIEGEAEEESPMLPTLELERAPAPLRDGDLIWGVEFD